MSQFSHRIGADQAMPASAARHREHFTIEKLTLEFGRAFDIKILRLAHAPDWIWQSHARKLSILEYPINWTGHGAYSSLTLKSCPRI